MASPKDTSPPEEQIVKRLPPIGLNADDEGEDLVPVIRGRCEDGQAVRFSGGRAAVAQPFARSISKL